MIDLDDIPLDDPLTWAMYKRADLVGVFQLESDLGKIWAKKLKISSIEELSDGISLIRPGPLESLETDLYFKRKIQNEEITYIHPILEPILKNTYGVMCYQEDCLRIVVETAGFTESEGMKFVKAISKKKPEEIAKSKELYIKKAHEKGIVSDEIAEEIFAKMQKFQRYGFNKSHGIAYSLNSYKSAWLKCHYPTSWYTSWLTFANEKQDPIEERNKLINDAKIHNIKILPPIVCEKNIDFKILKDTHIIFGLGHIRGIGTNSFKGIEKSQTNTWKNFLISLKKIKRGVAESLVKAGACDQYGLTRTEMLRTIHSLLGRTDKPDLENNPLYSKLSDNEFSGFLDALEDDITISDALQTLIDHGVCIEKRESIIKGKIKLLEGPFIDTAKQKSLWERLYIGCPLSCSPVDDLTKEPGVKTCKQIHFSPCQQKYDKNHKVYAVIDKVTLRKHSEKSKNAGATYAILSVSDQSCSLELTLWNKDYEKFKESLIEGSVVLMEVRKNKWNDRDFININKIQIVG